RNRRQRRTECAGDVAAALAESRAAAGFSPSERIPAEVLSRGSERRIAHGEVGGGKRRRGGQGRPRWKRRKWRRGNAAGKQWLGRTRRARRYGWIGWKAWSHHGDLRSQRQAVFVGVACAGRSDDAGVVSAGAMVSAAFADGARDWRGPARACSPPIPTASPCRRIAAPAAGGRRVRRCRSW